MNDGNLLYIASVFFTNISSPSQQEWIQWFIVHHKGRGFHMYLFGFFRQTTHGLFEPEINVQFLVRPEGRRFLVYYCVGRLPNNEHTVCFKQIRARYHDGQQVWRTGFGQRSQAVLSCPASAAGIRRYALRTSQTVMQLMPATHSINIVLPCLVSANISELNYHFSC